MAAETNATADKIDLPCLTAEILAMQFGGREGFAGYISANELKRG